MKIVFIQTGGTIDKDYPSGKSNHGYEFKIGEPAFTSILKKSNSDFNYEILSALKKDSLDIDDSDRQNIHSLVSSLEEDKIVITHGTDTISTTAKKLSDIKGKTIILTGAMLPEKFYDSDAEFNLGMSVGAVQSLPNGVYIALNGKVVRWEEFV